LASALDLLVIKNLFSQRIVLFGPQRDNIFEVIINPTYTPIPGSPEEFAWEGCFSIPLTTGFVKRFVKIHVSYNNEAGDLIEKDLEGWPARVWQHETDHLNGQLYDSNSERCSETKTFPTKEQVLEFRSEATSK